MGDLLARIQYVVKSCIHSGVKKNWAARGLRVTSGDYERGDGHAHLTRTPSRAAKNRYSITSSARASTVAGISMLSVLAVCRLTMNSNLVGSWTSISAGFSPLR